jgi:hypothetical protein
MTILGRLSEALTTAGIPTHRIEGSFPNPLIIFQESATQQQKDAAAIIVAGFDTSVAADIAWVASKQRINDSQLLDTISSGELRVLRGLVAVLVNELNDLRSWITSFKVQTAAATNLANFQSRVAGLPAMPNRTAQQARTAITDKILNGDVDN